MKNLILLFLFSFGTIIVKAQDKNMERQMMMKDHFVMKEGRMMTISNGIMMPMTMDVTLKNGTIVMTTGVVKKKNGNTIILHDGDRVMMNGSVKQSKFLPPIKPQIRRKNNRF